MNEPCFFVTGAAGFVGHHLYHRLRTAGHRVRALVRHDCRDRPELTAMGVEIFRGDLAEPAAWSAGLVGTDYVVHCAANASFGNGPAHATVNVDGTRHLLEAVRRHCPAVRRFVFVSTIGAVDRAPADACTAPLDEDAPLHPSSDYGRSKGRAEQLVRESGLPFAIVRPALVVGGDMRPDSHFAVFTRAAVRRAPLARFAWPGSFSVVHVGDLTAALELCAVHPAAAARTFFCAGPPLALGERRAHAQPAAAASACFGAADLVALPFPGGFAAGPAVTLAPAEPRTSRCPRPVARTGARRPLRLARPALRPTPRARPP